MGGEEEKKEANLGNAGGTEMIMKDETVKHAGRGAASHREEMRHTRWELGHELNSSLHVLDCSSLAFGSLRRVETQPTNRLIYYSWKGWISESEGRRIEGERV